MSTKKQCIKKIGVFLLAMAIAICSMTVAKPTDVKAATYTYFVVTADGTFALWNANGVSKSRTVTKGDLVKVENNVDKEINNVTCYKVVAVGDTVLKYVRYIPADKCGVRLRNYQSMNKKIYIAKSRKLRTFPNVDSAAKKSYAIGNVVTVTGVVTNWNYQRWYVTSGGFVMDNPNNKYGTVTVTLPNYAVYDLSVEEQFREAICDYATLYVGRIHYTQASGARYIGKNPNVNYNYKTSDLETIVDAGTTKGTDCSGFVSIVYSHFGLNNIPTSTLGYPTSGTYFKNISTYTLKKGDIVWKDSPYRHVEIYIGDGKTVGLNDCYKDKKGHCREDHTISNLGSSWKRAYNYITPNL